MKEDTSMARPATILLVEDNAMDVELILDAFREARLGNRIQVAVNGTEALAYLFGEGRSRTATRIPCRILFCWI